MRLTKLEGPGVWRSEDLGAKENWCQQLTDREIQEVVDAARHCEARNIPLFETTKDDFPLKVLAERFQRIQEELEGGRGFTVLRGFDPGRLGPEACKRVIWGLAQYLGTPEPQDRAGSLLHSVTNTGKTIAASDTARGYETDDELKFHNDGGDVFMLLCLRTAKEGGVSKLVSAGALFNAILDERPDLAAVLQQPFYFDSRAQNVNESKVQVVPVFTEHQGYLNVLYKRRYIVTAQRFPDIPRLTPEQVEALDIFDRLCADPALQLSFSMQPGDIQIGNNYSILHSRTKYVDHDDPQRRRHLYRLWLTLENSRPLPEVFGMTREFGPSYARRQQRQLAQMER
ncbi:taurine catabolism dioxygenase, TauD/TfdA family [Bordetella bronchiseptica MBORD675]|uniref:TauD/TfdA family dioxygenase n=1 Tax=Bordetella bronchiseptica TaxID=518 RepID=UPI0002906496|nr:TauD/TfdA family dioxygenase [Bordetella bronchiseptica]AZW32508.1 taurine catabolism dioxygenase TauD [Bordetella bronchiseptica]KCV43578.1 taurine catabolism dioxygenase, TauD/TfdA family [Bordetella bronchiseptica 345]KDC34312.1 taurine catabolism dioxygenase, TauD/TfdA family [Bordetella bronchiseptica GA96-01]KDC94869.1 taurine catabolism dioxygenase, TauD/TfdA family [Bordetella bronchiseptica MBORD675]CCN05735.1 taurine catabolism dioxygenase taud/tfda [Bordetella bronchiseptica Bbr7